jgi:TonB-dependent starch-binding outer membrane protein SusC
MPRSKALLAAILAALLLPVGVSAQNAIITGSVRSGTQLAVRGALVAIPSLELTTVTNDNGIYRLVVPASQIQGQQVTLVVSSIGYSEQQAQITLQAGNIQQDMTLQEEAIALDEVVVSGTAGRQERRAQAAVVNTINAARVAEVAPVQSVANVLQARTPGVMIRQTSGTAGTAQMIRIRGQSSISLSNEPLIFIDGIRADDRDTQIFGVGGQQGSRLNDIKIEDIESIEVVKGPAAATLYGADASAGVINIITKRGRAQGGFTQSITFEYGESDPNFSPPDNYGLCTAARVNPTSTATGCHGQAVGTVLVDNPLLRESSFIDGVYRNLNWTLRGGGERYGVFLSLGADENEGTLPNNEYGHISGRANFDFNPSDQLRMEFGFGLIRTTTQLPRNDNDIYGYLGGGLLGTPITRGSARDGWYASNRQTLAISSYENVDRALRVQPRVSVQYQPLTWLTNRLTFGGDFTRTRAYSFWAKNDIGWWDDAPRNTGNIGEARQSVDRLTLDYLGNATWNATENLRTDFSFGAQLITRRTDLTNAQGTGLVTNETRSVDAAAQLTGGGQNSTEERSVGVFGQAQFSFNERLYMQAGVRVDQHSAFGADSEPFVSPKVGVSYVISDEDFFRNAFSDDLVSTLKLRAAYGVTGRAPSSGARATYSPQPYAISTSSVEVGVIPQNPGNTALRAEKGQELEIGLDAGFFNDRLGLEATYFNKKTTDLILGRPLPGSLGFSQNPDVNIGGVVNRGFEVAANARLLTMESVGWEVRAAINTLHNEVTSLGDIEPFGTFAQTREGYPINGIFDYRIREIDLANNRVIVSDTMEFVGNPQNLPGWEATFSSTITLLRDLSFYAQADARGDYYVFNSTDEFRDRQFGTSRAAVLGAEGVPQEEYLRKFGTFVTESGQTLSRNSVRIGYQEDASFLRLRELSLNYRLPRDMVQRFIRAEAAQLTFSMRNLKLWTDYTGLDPETGQFLTVPQDRRWTMRFNVTF